MDSRLFMNPEEARRFYKLEQRPDSLFGSEVEIQLAEHGIATIEMPVSASDFQQLLKGYEVCLGECPELLDETYFAVDARFGNEAGHVRKERKINSAGVQVQDPKNLIHFNERARIKWGEQFERGPQLLRDFLADGYEIHNALVSVASQQFRNLEETHPNISRAYFPGQQENPVSCSFMRLLRYDAYDVTDNLGDVAKAHFDIGGATIQAYADAPGFWGAKDGVNGERTHYDTAEDKAYFFIGYGHKKLYGRDAQLQPLWHGVDRILPAGATFVPERHAVILFIDAPYINYGVTASDTLPYAATAPAASLPTARQQATA